MGYNVRMWKIGRLAALLFVMAVGPVVAEQPTWQACFTPGQDCTGLIVGEIDASQHTIRVQAYSFTSVPIWAALKAADVRGGDVEVIVDKTSARASKSGSNYSAATYLTNAGVPVWVDVRVSIAHNKVMVIDDATAITGSFNFTASAQSRNAENLLVIRDPQLAKLYAENLERRRAVSGPYAGPGEGAPEAQE